MKQVHVSAKRDHLQTLAATKLPLTAVAELIWNGLDADALNVSVNFDQNGISGIESIIVEDDGTGISHDEAEMAFGNLGGSWKNLKRKTDVFKRSLHGKSGKGRFRAFALGNRIEWKTRFKNNGSVSEYKILGRATDLEVFNVGDPTVAKVEKTGTSVSIAEIDKSLGSLLQPELLKKTTLSAVIEAAKTVADRLNFLKALEHLVYDTESKENLKERKQLHRIVANETWIQQKSICRKLTRSICPKFFKNGANLVNLFSND